MSLRDILLCVGAVVSVVVARVQAATPEQMDQALKKGIEFLYSQEDESGSWDGILKPNPDGKFPGDVKQAGGPTSLAVYALLTAGESASDEHITRALGYLKKVQPTGTYAVGFHANALAALPLTSETKRLIAADSTWIKEAMRLGKDTKVRGFYGYGSSPRSGLDRSTSQCAVLGAWGASQVGLAPGADYWTIVEKAWRAAQLSDGGWNYSEGANSAPSMSMTAAGVATLFLTQDFLHGTEYSECRGNAKDANIENGLKYLGEHFPEFEKAWAYYTLYGIERCGSASGYRYFGEHDWFAEGADWLVKRQAADGSWEGANTPSTAFALLFLGRGRAPVAVNKLQYAGTDVAAGPGGAAPTEGNWNQRPFDALSVCRWAGHAQERQLNFQIANINAKDVSLESGAILYISGNQGLNFSDDKLAILRKYVEEGGLIIGNADCSSKAFSESFKAMATKLFPDYEMGVLPADHPILANEQFPETGWKSKPNLLALNNGARVMMLLYASGDPAKYWELHMVSGREELTQSMADVLSYTISREELKSKGQTYQVQRNDEIKDERLMKLARLKYSGRWDPEPGAWRRMAAILHNEQKIGLVVEPVEVGAGKLDPAAYPLATLTGAFAIKLSDEAKAEIKKYVEGGGTLLVDACGGGTAFMTDVEPAIASLFGQKDTPVLSMAHKLYSSDMLGTAAIMKVSYRPFARKKVGQALNTPLIRGIDVNGRTAVYISREDLTAGMVGESIDGIIGYSPRSTKEIVQRLVLSVAAAAKPVAAAARLRSSGRELDSFKHVRDRMADEFHSAAQA